MRIYRDQNNQPIHIAYLLPSEFGQVWNWCRANHYTIGLDLVRDSRQYVQEIAGYVRVDVGRYPLVWHLLELTRIEESNG